MSQNNYGQSLEQQLEDFKLRSPKIAAELEEHLTNKANTAKARMDLMHITSPDVESTLARAEQVQTHVVAGPIRATLGDDRGGDEIAMAARIGGAEPYASREQIAAAVKDPQYRRSATYRAMHTARIAATDYSQLL